MAPETAKRRKLNALESLPLSAHADEMLLDDSDRDRDGPEDSSADEVEEKPVKSKDSQALKKSAPKTRTENISGNMYESSALKMQVEEMLTGVRLDAEKRLGSVEQALHKLKGLIEAIKDRPLVSAVEGARKLRKSHKISVPYPGPQPDENTNYKVAYAAPASINVSGSFVNRTAIKTDICLTADLIVTMPSTLFQDKDFLNYRYFHKRAYYLACLAAGLQDASDAEFSLSFTHLNGNSLQPILVAVPKSSKGKYEIHIIPTVSESAFPVTKLAPSKNSIRPKKIAGVDPESSPPTPFYNCTLRSDCAIQSYLQLLIATSNRCPAFRDVCILGRIWLRQRGFNGTIAGGGFGNFEWSALMALLLQEDGSGRSSALPPSYSAHQLFKGALQFLATTSLAKKHVLHQSRDVEIPKSDIPVFYDGSRGLNVLFKMTSWSYELLKEEANISLRMLNNENLREFGAVFITKKDRILENFDSVIHLHVLTDKVSESSVDHVDSVAKVANQVHKVLKEGLGNRIQLLLLKVPEALSWSMNQTVSGPSGSTELSIGLLHDPVNAGRVVDHGPPAEEKVKAAKFRRFWGEKAELRRFRDGSILESLIWSPGSDYAVIQEIVGYLVKQHFAGIVEDITFVAGGFDQLLPSPEKSKQRFAELRKPYSSFEQTLRDLASIPLQIRQISGISPQLRGTSVQAPDLNTSEANEAVDVAVHLESSSRWPEDIYAIQQVKVAFLLKLGSLLEDANGLLGTRLGLENADESLLNKAFLEAEHESGAVFRVRVYVDREEEILDRLVKSKQTESRTRDEAVSALATFRCLSIQSPLHTQSITTHCTRLPLLSPTIRLFKKWCASHMLSGHMSDELMELMVMYTFLHPAPWQVPSSSMTGFLRVLRFLSTWDWRSSPLVVDFGGDMTSEEISSIQTRFEAWRKIDPGMNRTVLFVASNHDPTGVSFTSQGPSKVIAARMTALARSATQLVKEKGLALEPDHLFVSSTSDFDFVIHISSKFVSREGQRASNGSGFKNLDLQSRDGTERTHCVISFFAELENTFSESAVFFHNALSPSVIAGVWNPRTSSRTFKPNLSFAARPELGQESDSQECVDLDKAATLSGIARLGGELVARVEVIR